MPTFRTPKQENQRNLQSPSEIEEIWISLCSDIQNQLHKSKPNRGLQIVMLKAADLAFRSKVISLFEDTNKLLKKVKMDLTVQEENL